jgi:hypothetical protein
VFLFITIIIVNHIRSRAPSGNRHPGQIGLKHFKLKKEMQPSGTFRLQNIREPAINNNFYTNITMQIRGRFQIRYGITDTHDK